MHCFLASPSSLGEQWKAKSRYDVLSNTKKRLFHFHMAMYMFSKDQPQDEHSDFFQLSRANWLNICLGVSESVERIIPGGCWIVRDDVLKIGNNRPGVPCIDGFGRVGL
jgi:hypothetical protein